METVRERCGVPEVVVVVQHGVGESLRHVADVLGLGEEVEHPVFDVLEDIRDAVRAVQVHIPLALADEGHVTHRTETLPDGDEVLDHGDVGGSLDVEVARIEVAAHIEARDEFKGLVLGVGRRALPVQVEMVRARRGLEISFLERLPVPYAIGLVDRDVVHVYRDPHIARGVGDLVIDTVPDDEVDGADIPVLDVVYARLRDLREVELEVVVLEIWPPHRCLAGEHLLLRPVRSDPVYGRRAKRLVRLVQLYHRHLRLARDIADLREADVRLAHPALHSVRLQKPAEHLACLALRQDAAEHIPAVLGKHAPVIELERSAVGADLDHPFRVVRGEGHALPLRHRKRIHETSGAAVIVGLITLELLDFLTVGTSHGLTHRIAREALRVSVHEICLVPVLGREEFEVEPGLALKALRHGLVKVDINPHGPALGAYDEPGIEIIIRITQANLDRPLVRIDIAEGGLGHQVPLLRSVGEAHRPALHRADSVMDQLDAGVLLIVEAPGEKVAVDENIDSRPLVILQVIKFQRLLAGTASGGKQGKRRKQVWKMSHIM